MESFFRRMSSIVRKGSTKSSDAEENDDEEEDDGRLRHFRQMQQRRRSAPDIRRRAHPTEKISLESDQKVTSFEQINSQNLTIQSSTTNLTRQQYHSTGMSSLFHPLK